MRQPHWILRCLALAAAFAVVLCCTAAAADGYREHREPPQPGGPAIVERTVTCTSGGQVLSGTLTLPAEMEGQVPVAILLHGLATDQSWCDDIAWTLAASGIASVRFDFSGTGESTGAQEDMTISTEVRDTLAVLDYVQGLNFTDTDNIFLVGKSMGGVDAVLAAQRRPGEIKALCLWYPGFGLAEAVRQGFLLGQFFDPTDLPETLTAAGYTFGKGFLLEAARLDCASACRSYDGPVLILHGDQDYIAPIGFSFAMSREFSDCTLQVIPGGGHGFWGYQELSALESMVEFLQANIT